MIPVAILTVLILLLIIGIVKFVLLYKLWKKTNVQENKVLYHDIDFDKIKTDFDNLINDEIDYYIKINPDLLQPGESYINREDFSKILNEITTRCLKRMTDPMIDNIRCIYRISSKDDLINIIGGKVGLVLTGMTVRINSSMLDETMIQL